MASGGFGSGAVPRNDETNSQEETPAYILDRPSLNVQKTPISYLQEMCTRKTLKPEYELLSTEGQVHDPVFMYRVTVGDLSAVGQGKSKKLAKHLAAKGVLERIIQSGRFKDYEMGETAEEATEKLNKQLSEPMRDESSGSAGAGAGAAAAAMSSGVSVTSDDGADGAGNPVGKLQEMCQQKKWPAPAYEVTKEEGPPHDRTFEIEASLGKFTATGAGNSKKNAKREAAERLLKFLKTLPPESQRENIGIAEEDELAEIGGTEAIIEQPSAELDEQFSNMGFSSENIIVKQEEKFGLKRLAEMDLSKEKPGEKHMTLLKMIGDDEHWEPAYYELPRRSSKGDYQCLVQLNSMPVAVCYGRGSTPEDARQSAAFSALEYLKLMTKEAQLPQAQP